MILCEMVRFKLKGFSSTVTVLFTVFVVVTVTTALYTWFLSSTPAAAKDIRKGYEIAEKLYRK